MPAILDFCSLSGFVSVGKAYHSADGSLDISEVLTNALPFLLTGFAASSFTGVHADSGAEKDNMIEIMKVVTKGWIVYMHITH
mmetsp:Transcript_9503/g.11066  ORF Transcript_9503/g.11066 Transcript_9503/m.11066 type:complete len:83 (-) Transcript_9503:122-370(-)